MLTIAAIALSEEWFSQWSGRRELSTPALSGNRVHASSGSPTSGKSVRPARGTPLGTLQVPRLNFSVVVLEGSDDAILTKGPGHIEETAFPGELGNVGIAGHRDRHFRALRNIQPNDEVILTTKLLTMHYFVDSTDVISPTDMEILDPTPGPTLTLVTCFPFDFIGSAPMRFVIRGTPRGNTYAKR